MLSQMDLCASDLLHNQINQSKEYRSPTETKDVLYILHSFRKTLDRSQQEW